MLLSSNVIHISVRVVILVRMIQTRLFAVAWVKSCPDMHSSCVIASLSGCARTVGRPPILGVAQELIKGNYWPLNRERKSQLSIKGRGP